MGFEITRRFGILDSNMEKGSNVKNIKFRPATANDAETLYHVKIAAFADEFEQFKYAEADGIFKTIVEDSKSGSPKEGMFSMGWHRQFCSAGDHATVIEDGETIIGSIVVLPGKGFGQEQDYPGYDLSQDDTNVLLCIYVLPEYKNKGVGAAAMEYMERLKPAKKWILSTPDVSVKNKRFYEKCGYKSGEKTGPNHILRIYTKGI